LDLRGRKWWEAEEDLHNEKLDNLYASQILLGWQVMEDEVSGACSTHGGEKCVQDSSRKTWDGKDWIHLAQDRDQWWALVNTDMELRVP
jgi:hypothetical protein